MKRYTITILAVAIAIGMPMAALAMKHMDHAEHGKAMAEEKMQHGDAAHADMAEQKGKDMAEHAKEMSHDMHKGHNMASGDDFVEIGKDTQNGVVATVKVKTYDADTKATMSKMGMTATHHVMVFFANEQSNAPVSGGMAALKVKGRDDKPVMLMQMGDGFGADVNLGEGMSTLEIGTKLADGEKRQFEVMFHNM